MKNILLILALLISSVSLFAQQDSVIIRDAWKKRNQTDNKQKDTVLLNRDVEMILIDTIIEKKEPNKVNHEIVRNASERQFSIPGYRKNCRSKFCGHLEFFRIGFVNFRNSDYDKYDWESENFMELEWAKSFNMQFKLASFTQAFSRNSGLVFGVMLEYQRLYFNRDLTVRKIDGMLQPVYLTELDIENPRRSVFKVLYLDVPVLLELHPFRHSCLHLSFGAVGGLRLHSKTKVVFTNNNNNKQKLKRSDSYHMYPFKADLMARVGFGKISFWGSYSLTPMFDTKKAPGLYPFAFGIGFGG